MNKKKLLLGVIILSVLAILIIWLAPNITGAATISDVEEQTMIEEIEESDIVLDHPGLGYNVVLISIDTLRADHLQTYLYDRNTDPYIQEFAKESILFENAYSTSAWTLPSHLAMFTGLWPHETYIFKGDVFEFARDNSTVDDEKMAVKKSYNTITEYLKADDYDTAGFMAQGYLRGRFGFDQGFDIYTSKGGRFESNIGDITNWIRRQDSDEKFFLFLHGYNPHAPYRPPQKNKEKFAIDIPEECITKDYAPLCQRAEGVWEYRQDLYDAEINYVDEIMNATITALKNNDLYEDTIIIITSDHGEGLNEFHKLPAHVNTVYEEVVNVPFIMKVPGYEGKTIKERVSNIALTPTVLDLLNISYNQSTMDVKSLGPLIKGEDFDQPVYLLTGLNVQKTFNITNNKTGEVKGVNQFVTNLWYGTFDEDFKLIIQITFNGNLEKKKYELYNLAEDPTEQINLANKLEYEELIKGLEADIDAWAEEANLSRNPKEFIPGSTGGMAGLGLEIDGITASIPPLPKKELSDEDKELLADLGALGYLN